MAKRFEIQNEQLLISEILKSEEYRKISFKFITANDFLSDRHQIIFSAVRDCEKRKVEVNHTNLASSCADKKFGGLEYLKKLDQFDIIPETDFLARIDLLRMDSARFQVSELLENAGKNLLNKSIGFFDCVKEISSFGKVLSFAPIETQKFVLQPGDFFKEFQKRLNGETQFVSIGYESLDTVLTEGLAPGNTTFIAGRPRSGKTIVLVDMVRRYLTRVKKKVLVIPFEKGQLYFVNMLVSSISGVELSLILKDVQDLNPDQISAVSLASKKVDGWLKSGRLTIMQNPVNRLIEKSRWSNESALDELEKVISEGGYDIGFYDLFERCLVNIEPQSLTRALVRLQTFGARYGIHQVVTQQLSRKVEEREDQRPLINDLKNSGVYEESGDQIFLIHREKIYKPNLPVDVLELCLAKQKLGVLSCVMLANFVPEICRLKNDRLVDYAELQKGNLLLRRI